MQGNAANNQASTNSSLDLGGSTNAGEPLQVSSSSDPQGMKVFRMGQDLIDFMKEEGDPIQLTDGKTYRIEVVPAPPK